MSEPLRRGALVRVKPDIWKDYCKRHQKWDEIKTPPEQPILDFRTEGPLAGYAMLAYPFYWWKHEELERVD